ncbi:glycine zipper domain-containing protein [Planctomycetota bacterium]
MSKHLITISILVLVTLVLSFIAGCQNDAQTGAAIGSIAGAGVGQLAGGDTEATLIGAAVGGGLGYFLGNEGDKKAADAKINSVRDEMNYVTVNVTNSNGSVSQVRLKKQGVGYVGTRNDYYPKLPTQDQLRPVYGF